MKTRGFTLIELLGVIIILALLIMLVFPNVINSIKKTNDKMDESTLNLIYNAADIYISNHSNDFKKENGNKLEILLDDLQAENLLPSSLKLSNEDITNTKCLQVTYTDKFNYQLKNIGECENYIWEICSLEEGTSKTKGAKYTCALDEERTFYVLEDGDNTSLTKGTTGTAGTGEISLIMDRNYTDDYVPIAMAWCDPNGANPRNIACNHDNLDSYIDYIQNNIFKNNIIVNLPTLEQLQAVNKSNTLVKSPWLYDYLYDKVNVYGYWTSSSDDNNSSLAWAVSYLKTLRTVTAASGYGGIRPVITISKSRLD